MKLSEIFSGRTGVDYLSTDKCLGKSMFRKNIRVKLKKNKKKVWGDPPSQGVRKFC